MIWTPGDRLDVFNVSPAKWREIKLRTGVIFHRFGFNLKARLDDAAKLPLSQYAATTNALYDEFNTFVNDTIGAQLGWVQLVQ